VPIPSDALRRDVSGKVLLPGLVDTHSHIGGVQGADASAPIQPDVRAIDAINVADSALQKAQAGGS
jgi:imidazolonepropionase-like amidohydrolase